MSMQYWSYIRCQARTGVHHIRYLLLAQSSLIKNKVWSLTQFYNFAIMAWNNLHQNGLTHVWAALPYGHVSTSHIPWRQQSHGSLKKSWNRSTLWQITHWIWSSLATLLRSIGFMTFKLLSLLLAICLMVRHCPSIEYILSKLVISPNHYPRIMGFPLT